MIKHVVITLLLFTGFLSTYVFACGCGGVSQPKPANNEELIERILSRADVVFIGKVTGFEYKKGILNDHSEEIRRKNPTLEYETKFVNFEVKRWWKGILESAVELRSQQTRLSDRTGTNSSCDYGFKEGEVYLVFANLSGGYLTTNNCLGNGPVDNIQDLHLLGVGNLPVKKQGQK